MCTARGSAVAEVIIENARVKVTKWSFAKRADNTGWHRHAFDYVVIPLFDGTLEIDLGNGEKVEAHLKNGVPYYRQLGIEHDVINANNFACAFVEVELLEPRAEETSLG